MAKVIDIEEGLPHKVSEVICLKCLSREICVRPQGTLLKTLECANCRKIGYMIETGEEIFSNE